jgi:peroxiredoxin
LPSAIEQIHRDYKDRGLVVLAVNIQESKETVARWVRDSKVTFRVVLDPPGALARAYGVTATPTTFIVGRDGKLVGKALGAKSWASERGRALLQALLAS